MTGLGKLRAGFTKRHVGLWVAMVLIAGVAATLGSTSFVTLGYAETNCSIIPQEKLGSIFWTGPPPNQPVISHSNPLTRENVVLRIEVERIDPNSQTIVRVLRVVSDDLPQSLFLVGKLLDVPGSCHKRLYVGDTGISIGSLMNETGELPAFYPIPQH